MALAEAGRDEATFSNWAAANRVSAIGLRSNP
jgi:hypothetical protein